ncbi:MAG: TIGR02757 family protein [Gemmatimonadota bacterium]
MVQPRGHRGRKEGPGAHSRAQAGGGVGHRRVPPQQGDPVGCLSRPYPPPRKPGGTREPPPARRALSPGSLSAVLAAHGGSGLSADPVLFPHRFADRRDAEAAAFIAASFAFGNVAQILGFLERLFAVLGRSPHAALSGRRPLAFRRVAGLRHRFISPPGVHRFLVCLGAVLRGHGSLEELYRAGMAREGGPRERLGRFLSRFRDAWGPGLARERDFLFPDPAKGSACKRHNLFLRWMVRGPDGVDLGLWSVPAPRDLVVPLDTHMARLCRWMGLTARRAADWNAAEEITAAFRAACPEDPVRYDFAITRIGILKACTAARRGECAACSLSALCFRRAGPPGN